MNKKCKWCGAIRKKADGPLKGVIAHEWSCPAATIRIVSKGMTIVTALTARVDALENTDHHHHISAIGGRVTCDTTGLNVPYEHTSSTPEAAPTRERAREAIDFTVDGALSAASKYGAPNYRIVVNIILDALEEAGCLNDAHPPVDEDVVEKVRASISYGLRELWSSRAIANHLASKGYLRTGATFEEELFVRLKRLFPERLILEASKEQLSGGYKAGVRDYHDHLRAMLKENTDER